MARNPIQFQHGLSLPAFLDQYGSEEQCRAALYRYRWPKGFVCPECGNTTCCQLSRGLYQCHRCHHQISLTAGTIFHATHLPLTTWLLAIYLLTQRKSGISALQLSRELGVAYNTAWKLKHKLLQVMHERNQGEALSGRIEVDDAYLGGERPGKRGRGAEHKFPFVAAVQTDAEGHPQRVQLRRVSGFTLAEIRRYAQRPLRLAVRSSATASDASAPSIPPPTFTSATSAAVGVPAWRTLSSTGSTRFSAMSRMRSPARTMPFVGSMPLATWPSSSTDSIDAMTSRP